MKTVKELLAEKRNVLSKFDTAVPQGYPKQSEVPAIIMLKRKAIRVYPDNQKVALYYSEAIDKYVSIPFGPEGKALGIQVNEDEINEAFTDYLPGYRSSREDFDKNVDTAKKEGVGGSVKKYLKKDVPRALMGAAPVGRGKVAARLVGRGLKKLGRKAGDYIAKRRAAAAAAAGGAAGAAAGGGGGGGGGGGDAMEYAKNAARRANTGREYSFSGDTAKRISEPVSTVGRANSNYRERQNQNQIWNTGSIPRSLAEFQSIIESKTPAKVHDITVTPLVAKKVIRVYESLNKQNKKNFEGMLNEATGLQKIINFCIKA